jgi:hypothetical protein
LRYVVINRAGRAHSTAEFLVVVCSISNMIFLKKITLNSSSSSSKHRIECNSMQNWKTEKHSFIYIVSYIIKIIIIFCLYILGSKVSVFVLVIVRCWCTTCGLYTKTIYQYTKIWLMLNDVTLLYIMTAEIFLARARTLTFYHRKMIPLYC